METKEETLIFDSHPQALAALVNVLSSRKVAPDREYYIVLTPDRYTQTVESALFADGGAIDCEVLTLSRLARRVCPSKKTISREGGVMITARAIEEVKDSLVYYKGAARFPDFAREAYETLQQIASSAADIREAAAAAGGITATKLNELALIKDAYDRRKAESEGSDATDRLTALRQAAAGKAELIANSHFYAVGFSDPTRLNRIVLDAIRDNAKSFCEFCVPHPLQNCSVLPEIICASDKITEYKEIAARICEYVRGGAGRKYSDISIISAEPRALRRILDEYGIAVYADEAAPLAVAAPFRAIADVHKISTALALHGAIDCATLVALCKNPYSGCDPDGAELIQNYVARYGLSVIKRGFDFPLRRKDENDNEITVSLSGAVKAMARAMSLVDEYDKHASFAAAVNGVIDEFGFDDISAEIDGLDTDTVAPISALTDLLGVYGSGNKNIDAEAMTAAARAVQIKSVPRERDCVTVTVPSALRLATCKVLFVADFNEGVLPVASADTGMLCDAELESLGGKIEPTVREANRRSRTELAAVVHNAQRVIFAYSTEDKAKRASYMNELCSSLPCNGCKRRVFDCDKEHKKRRLRLPDCCDKAPFDIDKALYDCDKAYATLRHTHCTKLISKYAPTTGAARELAALGMTETPETLSSVAGKGKASAPEFSEYLYGDPASPEYEQNRKPRTKKRISSSELTSWFECPYKRFLINDVGLAERAKKRAAPDYGTVIHLFMKKFMSAAPYDLSRANIERIVDEAIAEKDIHPDAKALKRIYDNAEDYAKLNVGIVKPNMGSYVPQEFEFDFYLPGYLGNTDDKLDFKGTIDRFDVCGSHARVLDYKTGSDEYDLDKCLNGTKMQLPLYAAALRDNSANTVVADGKTNVDYTVTGMFYVKLAKKFNKDKPDKPLGNGCVVRDENIISEYDPAAIENRTWSSILPVRAIKDESKPTYPLGKPTKKVMNRPDFDALIDRCKANADTAVDEIRTGYIARSPVYYSLQDNACRYCSYRGLCGNVVFRGGDVDGNDGNDGSNGDDETGE